MVSIDPSTKRMALAVWKKGVLQKVLFLRSDLKGRKSTLDQLHALDLKISEIAIEGQEIYRGRGMLKKSIIKLAQYAGIAVGSLYKPGMKVTWYLPKEWKGQVPKDAFLPRIKKSLSEKEISKIELTGAKGPDHDIWDAIGIGLFHLDRL